MTLGSQTDVVIAVQAGQLVSFPTDTVPALAARPDRAELIYAAKQRTAEKPLILMAAQAEALWPYVQGDAAAQAAWKALAAEHWPGAVTLVLPASGRHPTAMTPQDNSTLGIRVPDSGIARAILAETGPLATTSANRSGEAALVDAEAIAQAFPQATVLHPQASAQTVAKAKTAQTQPSTVIAWSSAPHPQWTILRQGSIIVNP